MISVVTAAYNAEKHIADMIMSVASQPENVQLIVVNDGSKDRTADICRQCRETYGPFEYYEIDNHGAGYARNYGLAKAQGDWIVFLDSDDLLIDGSINGGFADFLAQCEKQDVDIVYSCRAKADFNLAEPPAILYPEEEVRFHLPRLEFWTCVYRHEFLVEKKVAFFEYREQDIETAFRYRAFSRAHNVMTKDDLCFYLQRDNPASNMHTYDPVKLNRVKALVYDSLLRETEFPDDADLLATERKNAVYRYLERLQAGEGDAESDKNLADMRKLLNEVDKLRFSELGKMGAKEFCRYRKSCRNRRKALRKASSAESHRANAAESATDISDGCASESRNFTPVSDADFEERWRNASKSALEKVANKLE